jgi:hypothetical protein
MNHGLGAEPELVLGDGLAGDSGDDFHLRAWPADPCHPLTCGRGSVQTPVIPVSAAFTNSFLQHPSPSSGSCCHPDNQLLAGAQPSQP